MFCLDMNWIPQIYVLIYWSPAGGVILGELEIWSMESSWRKYATGNIPFGTISYLGLFPVSVSVSWPWWGVQQFCPVHSQKVTEPPMHWNLWDLSQNKFFFKQLSSYIIVKVRKAWLTWEVEFGSWAFNSIGYLSLASSACVNCQGEVQLCAL